MSDLDYARILGARSIAAFERGIGNEAIADVIIDLADALERSVTTHE